MSEKVSAGKGKPGRRAHDLRGMTFGALTMMERAPNDEHGVRWHARCQCGKELIVTRRSLNVKGVRSCGCQTVAAGLAANVVHGATKTTEHRAWLHMRAKCTNPAHPAFKDFGKRGIKVCKRWDNFSAFYADMGPRPSASHQLSRTNPDGDYEPSNCRWTQPAETNRAKRSNVFLTFNGRRQVLTDWAREMGLDPTTLRSRLWAGWSLDQALTIPADSRNRVKKLAPTPFTKSKRGTRKFVFLCTVSTQCTVANRVRSVAYALLVTAASREEAVGSAYVHREQRLPPEKGYEALVVVANRVRRDYLLSLLAQTAPPRGKRAAVKDA